MSKKMIFNQGGMVVFIKGNALNIQKITYDEKYGKHFSYGLSKDITKKHRSKLLKKFELGKLKSKHFEN